MTRASNGLGSGHRRSAPAGVRISFRVKRTTVIALTSAAAITALAASTAVVSAAPVGASEAAAAIPVAHVVQLQDTHLAQLDAYVAKEQQFAANRAAAAAQAKKAALLAHAKTVAATHAAAEAKARAHRAAVNRAARAAALAAARARAAAKKHISHYYSPASARGIAQRMLKAYGWATAKQWSCLNNIWSRESHWRVSAGSVGGAYGIPQALPGSKMASAGSNWRTNATTQIAWGLSYIHRNYGSPCGAWAHWQAHGWY